MAIVLTTAISVPNIQRVVLARPPQIFENDCLLTFEARSGGAPQRVKMFDVWVRNSVPCDVIKKNLTAVKFDEDIIIAERSLSVAGAADQVEAAYRTGATKAAALRAVETACLSLGIVD